MTQSATTRVGLVPLARTTFDIPLATQMTERVRARLAEAGLTLVGPNELVTDAERVRAAAGSLVDDPPDLLLVLQATFADSTMVMELTDLVDAPLLLWALPETPSGGRLRLNSLCGINLAAHALKRAGRRYDYLYAEADDDQALAKVDSLARAGRARRLLRQAQVGRIGEHPDGFDSCQFDGEALRQRFGLEVVQVALADLFNDIQAVDEPGVEVVLENISARLDGLDALDQTALRTSLRAYLAMDQLAQRQGLNGLAVRCWPEFFTQLGCAACGAMSMLSDQMIPCSCEVDVNGTITQFILQSLSGEPAFGSDLVSVDLEKDAAVLWHCGLAPLSMADPEFRPRGTIHSNRQLPLLMEFPLKPGRVTVARLSQADGAYRLVVGSGTMLRAPLSFSGTSGVLRFDRPVDQVLDTILQEGLEHHFSLTYGDHSPALFALGRMLDLPVLCL